MSLAAPRQTDNLPASAAAGFQRLGTLPVAAAIVTALNALYIFLAGIGNMTDFDTNLTFVQHVLAMDTTNFGAAPGTELDPDVMWRAITAPRIQTALYLVIIVWEWASAIVLIVATVRWLAAFRAGAFNLNAPRRLSSIGFTMIAILFMGGFISIGGEWFQMWRSEEWNGLTPAFHNAVLALFGLVMVHLPSAEWTSRSALTIHD